MIFRSLALMWPIYLFLFSAALEPAFAGLEIGVQNKAARDKRERYCQNHFFLVDEAFPGPSPRCRGRNKGYKSLATFSNGFRSEYEKRREFCKETLKSLGKFEQELISRKIEAEKNVSQSASRSVAGVQNQGGSFVGLADVHSGHAANLEKWNKEIIALRMKYASTGREIKQRLKLQHQRMRAMQKEFTAVPAECVAEVRKNLQSVKALTGENERLNQNYDLIDGRGKAWMEHNRAAIAKAKEAEGRALASAKDLNEVSSDEDAPKTAEEWAEFDKKNGYDKSKSTVYNEKETAQKLKEYYSSDPKLSALVNGSEEDRMALQRALKTANPNLVVDGQIGRRTLDTLTNTLGDTSQKNAFYDALRAQGYNINPATVR